MLTAYAATETADGVHGMLLFSDGKSLFASHLAMLHAPHNMQIVVQLTAINAQQQAELIQSAEQNILSIEPQRFDLLRLKPAHAQPLRQFSANVFSGHFERGGHVLGSATFLIDNVLLFAPIVLHTVNDTSHEYFAIPSVDGHFLLHKITHVGDFDQILRLQGPQLPVLFSARPYGLPGDINIAVQTSITRQVWWETDDFSQ